MEIIEAKSDEQINASFAILSQLRPELIESEFLSKVRCQMSSGYQLLYLYENQQLLSVAGFRISENLAWGKHMYVDDLVTDQQYRSQGAGQALLNTLIEIAKNHQCLQLHLDSGVQRFDAHRFYLNQGMRIASHHLMLEIL